MLDGLDDVDWASRTHAFGEASDIPALLRKVARGGRRGRAAVGELFNTVWHQGTVYDATAAAVPFIAELAASEQVDAELRESLLVLLFAIGRGQGYWQVHAGSGSDEDDLPDGLDDELAREGAWVRAARQAVERDAASLLDRIDEFPGRLWVAVAVLAVVAGPHGRSAMTRLVERHPPLPTFAALGLQALAELLTTGRLSPERVTALEELDDDLAELAESGGGAQAAVTLDADFVDVLVERLHESRGGR